jgi:hypothetical protein
MVVLHLKRGGGARDRGLRHQESVEAPRNLLAFEEGEGGSREPLPFASPSLTLGAKEGDVEGVVIVEGYTLFAHPEAWPEPVWPPSPRKCTGRGADWPPREAWDKTLRGCRRRAHNIPRTAEVIRLLRGRDHSYGVHDNIQMRLIVIPANET